MAIVKFALLYRRRYKWSVIPSDGKTPIVKWKQYQTELPDIDQIEEWWSEYPQANISLVTGKLSGVVVFDADSQTGINYAEEKGMPYTPIVQSSTPDRRHYYLKYPTFKDNRIITNVSKSVHKTDLEVKGKGGLTVLPPSIHKSGVKYKWINTPEEYPIAEMDLWHLEFCLNHKKRSNNIVNINYGNIPDWAESALGNGVGIGERDTTTYSLARCFYKRGFEEQYTIRRLIDWNRNKNEKGRYPYFTDNHVKKCIRSAYGKR